MESQLQSGKRPRALGERSTIGVLSIASRVEPSALEAGCAALRTATGWQVETSPVMFQCDGDFQGTPIARAAALAEMWQRNEVDAIVCARGGYGTNYLLPLLDFDALKVTPKAFVGYSDNTSLLLALDRAGIVCFHGPMVASDFAVGRADEDSFRAALRGNPLDLSFSPASGMQSLIAGEARGTLIGGCLSVVVTSLGTPWEIETAGRILFLEDVNEKPFRIDRMLMHLLLAGKFRNVRGVIFGAMPGCFPAFAREESLPRMILRILGGLGVPIVFGFPSGHVESGNITLPFGVPAVLQSSEAGVRLQVEPSTRIEPRIIEPGIIEPRD
jgi:muramoyltetrapeptide carboxypeptidase